MSGATIDANATRVAVAVVPQSAVSAGVTVVIVIEIVSVVISNSVIKRIHEIVHMSVREIAIENESEIAIGIGIVQGGAIISGIHAVAVGPRHRHVVIQHAIIISSSNSNTSI